MKITELIKQRSQENFTLHEEHLNNQMVNVLQTIGKDAFAFASTNLSLLFHLIIMQTFLCFFFNNKCCNGIMKGSYMLKKKKHVSFVENKKKKKKIQGENRMTIEKKNVLIGQYLKEGALLS